VALPARIAGGLRLVCASVAVFREAHGGSRALDGQTILAHMSKRKPKRKGLSDVALAKLLMARAEEPDRADQTRLALLLAANSLVHELNGIPEQRKSLHVLRAVHKLAPELNSLAKSFARRKPGIA
jgi:hypothetical protein